MHCCDRRLGTPATRIVRWIGARASTLGRRPCGAPAFAPAGLRPAPLRAPPQVRKTRLVWRGILIQLIYVGGARLSRRKIAHGGGTGGGVGVVNPKKGAPRCGRVGWGGR